MVLIDDLDKSDASDKLEILDDDNNDLNQFIILRDIIKKYNPKYSSQLRDFQNELYDWYDNNENNKLIDKTLKKYIEEYLSYKGSDELLYVQMLFKYISDVIHNYIEKQQSREY